MFVLLASFLLAICQDRSVPPFDLSTAVVFTVNEGSGGNDHAMQLMKDIPCDLMLRAWFKWREHPPVEQWANQPAQAHSRGCLFGGGITCSALYDGENGLSKDQVMDMATRDPAGNLVDAWGQAGIRHGSLSSPAYVDYLFRWCREQIDAGVDSLFMDERDAALTEHEGYDDHTLDDFRRYLIDRHPNAGRLNSDFGIDVNDREVCPSGRIDSFSYRAYLKKTRAVQNPAVDANRLFGVWLEFRTWRDDSVWAALLKRIRDYASAKGRSVSICGNGLAPGVDLQVLGVWDRWVTKNGRIDMSENQIPIWRSTVEDGQELAGRNVPVVLFHDWGFGSPPFPYLAVPPADRIAWIRTRGAEIYASGGFFAFPVFGPGGCDAGTDGTLAVIQQQARFYQAHKDLYLGGEWLGWQAVKTESPSVSSSVWWLPASHSLAVHVVNRQVRDGQIVTQHGVKLSIPTSEAPTGVKVVSPDFSVAQPAPVWPESGHIVVVLPTLDAYSVVLLKFDVRPNFETFRGPTRVFPQSTWTRPTRNQFNVSQDGRVSGAASIIGFIHGRIHPELKNPPTFSVDFRRPTRFRMHIRSVATQGARVSVSLDGVTATVVALPDLDGKNDPSAREYDKIIECEIPRGPHRITVDNAGNDWAFVDWYEFGT